MADYNVELREKEGTTFSNIRYYLRAHWDNLDGKPSFYNPASHEHNASDITGLQSALDGKAPLASPAFTGSPTAPTQPNATNNTTIATTAFVKAQSYVSSSEVQDAVNTREPIITGAATTITGSNLTVNRALISNASGKVAVSAVTSTELGYLSGVTSAIQTQLNGRMSTSHAANVITSTNITNWNTAFGWGNHASVGYLTALPAHGLNVHSDVVITSPGNGQVLKYNGSNWVNAADNDTNNYVTGVSGSGNGTVTFTRQGLTNLTWDASHSHTFASLTSKPDTLAGYGITDAYTKTEVNAIGNTKENVFSKNTAFNKNFGTTAGTVAEGNHSHALGDLSNVAATAPSTGQVLKWNGSQWAPGTDNDTNNYVTGITGSGNGNVSFTRQGLTALTFDFSHTHTKAQVGLGSVENYGIATLAEAQAGTSDVKYMTPLRVFNAIDNHTPGTVSLLTSKTSWSSNDVNTFFRMNNTSNITINVPTDATINFAIGTEMHFMRYNTGEITINPISGVTLLSEGSKRRINLQYQVVTIKKVASNTWVMFGALKT